MITTELKNGFVVVGGHFHKMVPYYNDLIPCPVSWFDMQCLSDAGWTDADLKAIHPGWNPLYTYQDIEWMTEDDEHVVARLTYPYLTEYEVNLSYGKANSIW